MLIDIDESKHISKLARGILEHFKRFMEENNINNSTLVDEFVIARKQRVDFVFPFLKNKVFIEVHGEQHFKSVEHFGGEHAFNKRKALDRGKKEVLDVYFPESMLIEFGYKKIKYEEFLRILEPAVKLIKAGDVKKEEIKEIETKELRNRTTNREVKSRGNEKEIRNRNSEKEIKERENKRKNKFLE